MLEHIEADDRGRTGRPPTEVSPEYHNEILERLRPHLVEWQHPGSLAKRLELPHGIVATVLRRAAADGDLHTVRTNPTSYRLATVVDEIPSIDVDDVDDMDDIPLDSLRWLSIHLSAPCTLDELCNGTRARMDQVVEHVKAGIAAGYVTVSGDKDKVYSMRSLRPEELSRGIVQISALRRRMERHVKGTPTSAQIVRSMGLTRERVRQILERAEERGIVQRLEGRPLRFKVLPESPAKSAVPVVHEAEDDAIGADAHPVFDQPIRRLPITTRAVNVLDDARIGTVGDLVRLTRDRLAKLPGMGRKSVDEIVMALVEMGLTLGMLPPLPEPEAPADGEAPSAAEDAGSDAE